MMNEFNWGGTDWNKERERDQASIVKVKNKKCNNLEKEMIGSSCNAAVVQNSYHQIFHFFLYSRSLFYYRKSQRLVGRRNSNDDVVMGD